MQDDVRKMKLSSSFNLFPSNEQSAEIADDNSNQNNSSNKNLNDKEYMPPTSKNRNRRIW